METVRKPRVHRERRWLSVVFVLVCITPAITGVVDVTIVSKYQFFDESADTWLYCYYTGSFLNQNGYQFGVEVNTGEGTMFTRWRGTGSATGVYSVRMDQTSGNSRVGAFSCQVATPTGSQPQKAITFKIKSQADVWPVTFTVTANTGDPVTLQMVQKSSRNGTLVWRKDGLDGTILTGQNGLNLTIASVQSSDEGIYECYYQGDTDRKQGIMRLIVRGCAENKWGPPSCTGDCSVCYNGGVCDDNTGECVCPPGFHGQNCESACANNQIGTSCTRECEGGDCTGQLLCVMDPYGCSCAPGLMGIECNTECPDGMYGAGCTQTCHCANGPTACDKKTGVCNGGCLDMWTGGSCQIATVSYEGLFTKEEGRFFGDSADHIADNINMDIQECARRCLQDYGSDDGVNPVCLSFNHRPAGSPEASRARCWLRSSDKDTAASPGSEWDSWPYRNYYQRKHILAPQDCTDIFNLGIQYSHVYTIGHPQPFRAYCDMDTDGGGWTVIQRRQDGSVPFDRHWAEYEQGFGNPSGEYWLGLRNIHSLTTQKQNELYVYLEDWEMNSRFARYSTFSVGDAGNNYTATIDGYSGDATDSLDPPNTRHSINNRQFSTTDQDNDPRNDNCASLFGQGGWWYTPSCGYAMLNGQYLSGCSVPAPGTCSSAEGIVWYSWKGYTYSLKTSTMMIRRDNITVQSFRTCQNGGTLITGPEGSGLYICACAEGWHGAFCDQECGHCHMGQICDGVDGTCPTGGYHVCAAGYDGTKCDQECSGTHGPDCATPCGHCYGGSICERVNGNCPAGGPHVCAAGYHGDKCDQVCSGTYGPDCNTTCGHCYGNQTCDGVPGTCPTRGAFVCTAGYRGDNCHQECNDGNYGNDCVEICGNCTEGTVCEKTNGNCPGCEDPWVGDTCKMRHPDGVTVNVTAVNSTTLHVTWSVGVTGNLDIIDSQVRYKRSDTEDWGDWESIGVSNVNGDVYIYGLRPATMYDVQVRVNNSLGWSDPGSGRMGTTDEARPGPPRNLLATPSSHSSVHLTWEPPIEPNGEIVNYTVRYGASESCSETRFPHQVTTSDHNTTAVIRDLVPYTNYTFRVRGATSAGGGHYSDCNITRTLEYYPTAPVIQTFVDQHDCNCQTPNIPRPVQLHVAWRRPDHIHGQLQAYRVSLYNRTGGEPFYQENVTSGLQQENLTAVVTSSHLQPANNYSVTISAINTFYRGNESHPYMVLTSDGCPDAPTVTWMADSKCGVNWTGPTETQGRLTGYNVTYTDTPLHNPGESEPRVSHNTSSVDQHQWSKSLDDLPANSRVRVTVRAVTCAEGDKGKEFTCEVLRVEPPPPPVLPTGLPPKPSATSFPVVLPKVSERNGLIRCCQIIVITMNKDESLADLETRVGEPDVMLTEDAPADGKTQPYVALSLSKEEYKSTKEVLIGDGGPCGHEWCCERSELADPRLAKNPGNVKLRSGEKYTAAVRCYVDNGARRRKRNTERLFTTSGYIEPVITETEQPTNVPVAPIVGGSVAALIVVIVLVTVGIVCHRKRNTKDDQNLTGLQIGLKAITKDEPSDKGKESADNPACTALDEDGATYETTIYSSADLVSVDDVVDFLRATDEGLGQYAAVFRKNRVDGVGALSLTGDMLAELVPEVGPRAKLQKALQELKGDPESAESNKPVHNDWEIPRSSLTLGKVLGKGQFGEVRLGELRKRGVTQTVAVKTLKEFAEERDKEDLKGELDILVTVGRHDNIISLVGACTVEGPLVLVVEYAPNGCLKDWLKDNRPEELNQTDIPSSGIQLPMDQLIMFGIDIANGMSHLAAMQCVHRDLAARNVLLGMNLTAKISDFGLSRDIYEESEYVTSTKSQLPVRWLAYESLFYHVYTTQSDVWSFGILLWEIMTMGKKPYGQTTGKELMKLLPTGYRLEKPAVCSQDVYDVMTICWETLPENRPTFPQLKSTLDRIIQDHTAYASLMK